jgi:hypothetical protein
MLTAKEVTVSGGSLWSIFGVERLEISQIESIE